MRWSLRGLPSELLLLGAGAEQRGAMRSKEWRRPLGIHFARGKVCMPFVGKASDIKPGQLKAVEVDGTIVAIANVDGTYYAFSDDCTHGGCSLSQGDLWGTVINCPC